MLSLSRLRNAWRRRAAIWMFRRPITIAPTRPLVSFSFDDFPRNALEVGGAILEDAGARGTYYTSLGLAGQTTPTGKMFGQNDLQLLLARGHELGCHTYDHSPAWETSAQQFDTSVARNAEVLHSLVPAFRFKTLSYPISYPRPATKRLMSRRFSACRGGGQNFNHGLMDANYLKSFFIEQSRDNLDHIRSIVDANSANNGWLIFSTHDVDFHPTRYGCTPAQFETIVRYTVESGAEVLPISHALTIASSRER